MSNARLGETQDRFDFVTGEWLGVIDQRGREIDIPTWNTDGTLRTPAGGSVGVGGGKAPIALLKPAGSFENAAGVLGYTLSTTVISPVPFYAVRVRLYGVSTSPVINVLAGVAPSANVTSGVAVSTGTNVNVTVGGATAITVPAAISAGGTVDAIQSEVVSDWIQCASIPRDDGGAGYLLVLRVYQPSAGNTDANRISTQGYTAAHLAVSGLAAVAQLADKVTTWSGWSTAVSQISGAFGLELLTATGVVSVGCYGDSTMAGTGNTWTNMSGAVISALANGYGIFNGAEAGSQSTSYLTRMQNAFANGSVPKVAGFCPFSPNDTDKYTAAGTARQISGALLFLNECKKYGIYPILVTPCPVSSLTAPQEAFRRQVVAACKSISTSMSCGLVDRDSVYTDYSGATGGWLAGLNADTQHPNATGYALEAALWTAAIPNFV